MADDAHSHFIDGLRVTAEHLEHMQDSLHDALLDFRRAIGLGRVVWGLRVTEENGSVRVEPGCAFAPSGVRLSIDAPLTLAVDELPARVVLRAANEDKAALRVGGTPTLILGRTNAALEDDDGTPAGDDALVLAAIRSVDGKTVAEQDAGIFIAAGNHKHSGEFVQDEQGRWHYDGAPVAGGVKATGGGPGAQGPTGPAGPIGPAGPVGPIGPAGPAGEKGEKGDPGDTGAAGAAGAKGDKGDKGDPGVAGAPGAAGAKGDKGDKGDPGAAGAVGAAGAKGDKGDRGDPGAAGAAGAAGAKGDKGDKGDPGAPGAPGAAGAKGDKGDKGDPGAAGAAGAKGDKGDPGAPGARGAAGPPGPPGPPGAKGDPGPQGSAAVFDDFPHITAVNWSHGAVINASAMLQALTSDGLVLTLSKPLHRSLLERQAQVVEVFFAPDSPLTTAAIPPPQAIVVIHGGVKLGASQISWISSDRAESLKALFARSGRLQIRVHAGHLIDTAGRPFSSAVDALTRFNSLRVPGGTWESWMFVTP